MADGMLSQEEIDALTKGEGLKTAPDDTSAEKAGQEDTQEEVSNDTVSAPQEKSAIEETVPAENTVDTASPISQETLSTVDSVDKVSTAKDSAAQKERNADITDIERDTLGEIGNMSMGSAATSLSMILNNKVSITTPTVSVETMDDIKLHYPMPYLIVGVSYTKGITGKNIFAIQAGDAAIIADLMMGGNGTNVTDELDEIRQSAVSEAMNQMMGAVSTSLSQIFKKTIDISPPQVQMVDMSTSDEVTEFLSNDDPIIKISFKMEVEGIIDSEIMQILPLNVAKELVKNLLDNAKDASNPVQSDTSVSVKTPELATPAQPTQQPVKSPMSQSISSSNIGSNVSVQPAQFTPLTAGNNVTHESKNIDLILDVPLNITVQLGSTKKSIREILELSSGSVLELDKLAGEPVDILVNGKFLAKGEVVVIDENFGVRITDIATPLERTKTLS